MGILGVKVSRSWWYPHCQMFKDFYESTCSTPSGILIFKGRGVSRRPRVVLPVVSWFRHLVIRGIFLFQTTTFSSHSSIQGTTTATVHMVSCRSSCIVCSKKSRSVGLCLSSRSGRVTSSQTIRPSQQSRISISLSGLVCTQHWRKRQAST